MDFTAATSFLKDFGLPLGMALLFTLMLVTQRRLPDRTLGSPYLVPGSALDAALAECDRLQSASDARELTTKLEWQRLREEERLRAVKAEDRLADIIPMVHEQTRLLHEIRLEAAKRHA